MDEQKENLTGHDYDGIQEYDNPLPIWWLATFIGTVIFGFIYWLHYEFGGGPTLAAEFNEEMKQVQQLRPSEIFDSEDELKKLAAQAGVVANGKNIFIGKCAACHGDHLQGIIGPNLTDEYWLHGKGKLSDITGIVRKGVLDKGMPSWESMLKDDEIKSVAVFVYSTRGSNPANPKAPQGEKVGPE